MVMTVTEYSLNFNVAELPNGQFVAVCNMGGFTLRGSVCKEQTDAIRSLFQMIGGASGYANPDADIAVAMFLSGTTLQEVGQRSEIPATTSTESRE